ncbi:sensor histidine kinase [Pontibacter chitinilyticus]|uniref:sensor histidine kinase n=1 Tax=Pontibacter chitinilyticus TaxID=2674989 RepID=UPI00321C2814
MHRRIFKLTITNELDVVLAYKRAMQLSERLKIPVANQTKFATAVSEICRNVVEYAGSGSIQFSLVEENGLNFLEALIADHGRGIADLEYYTSNSGFQAGRGSGIVNSKKLVDYMHMESHAAKGTRVVLRKRIPATTPAVTKAMLDVWIKTFEQEKDISPYAEIKRQNMQLLELLDQLHLRNLETEQQLQEIRKLNLQLNHSNQEISHLLEEREKKNDLLQRINADLDAFAHTVSHDLRAPLQNINGLATALEACLKAEQLTEAQHVFPMLRQQTYKMDRLITSILAYSLAGHSNIPKQVIDLQILLYHVVSSLTVPATFRIVIAPKMPVLYTQEIYLFQVFSNIIGNAIKYHHNPDDAEIAVSYALAGRFVAFSVKDNGPGIAQETQANIFEMYEKGGSFPRADSSGLGLSIVKRIVEVKGGSIRLNSTGDGSEFIFTWPSEELVKEEPS